jgi:uncharacterized membrane protein
MDRDWYRRNSAMLWLLLLIGVAATAPLYTLRALTGSRTLDGGIGVMLGLFICSRPAGNAVDLLFFHPAGLREAISEWQCLGWLALNILVLAIGWVVIFLGAIRFVGRVG